MKKIENIRTYVWIEVAIWFLILCFAVAGVRVYRYHKSKELSTYQIFISDVDGIIVGSPVKFMGVQVGYIDKVKIVANDVYVKFIITDKELSLPRGVIATVEFNGMGGSKSLELYSPTKESLNSKKLIVVQNPTRLHDSAGLMNAMFEKIGSITKKLSYFAKEASSVVSKNASAVDTKEIKSNINIVDKWLNQCDSKRNKRIQKNNKKHMKELKNE